MEFTSEKVPIAFGGVGRGFDYAFDSDEGGVGGGLFCKKDSSEGACGDDFRKTDVAAFDNAVDERISEDGVGGGVRGHDMN